MNAFNRFKIKSTLILAIALTRRNKCEISVKLLKHDVKCVVLRHCKYHGTRILCKNIYTVLPYIHYIHVHIVFSL